MGNNPSYLPAAATKTTTVTIVSNELLTPEDVTVRSRNVLVRLSNFLAAFAAGGKTGTVDVQDGAVSSGQVLTPSTGTLTFASVAAGVQIEVNGVKFIAVSGTPIRSNNEFKIGVSDTADAADFSTTFNASASSQISGLLVSSAASGVVTISPSTSTNPPVSGGITNAVTIGTLGIVASGTLTPAATAATDTILINGATLTFEKEMARQTATVSTGVAGDTVVVNGVTFTCVASGAGQNQFNVGGTDTITAANLAAAINASNSGVFGTITAKSSSTTLSMRAVASGTGPNAYTLTATGGWTATGATFSGGLATSNNHLDYGDTNSQTVAEILRAVAASTTALINTQVFLTPVYELTSSGGSGVQTVTINGVTVSATWATSDTASILALKVLINANAALAATCVASVSAGVLIIAPLAGQTLTISTTGTGMSDTSFVNVYSVFPGIRGNAITIAATGGHVTASGARLTGGTVTQWEGVQASGTVTITSGSGNYTVTINGVNASGTVAFNSTDNTTASNIADAINKSTDALVAPLIHATVSTNVVTITAIRGGVAGNNITLACTGTGAVASVTRLAGGAVPTEVVLSGARLAGGTNGLPDARTE